MAPELRDAVLRILGEHRIMTLATNRSDGWPQATVVGYANDGLKIYCFVSRLGQKYSNIVRDPRVSAAIASDFSDPLDIKGLSLAAKAATITEGSEFDRAYDIFLKRYPEYAAWPRPNPAAAPCSASRRPSSLCWTIPRGLATATLSRWRKEILELADPIGTIGLVLPPSGALWRRPRSQPALR